MLAHSYFFDLTDQRSKDAWPSFVLAMMPLRRVLFAPEVINQILRETGKQSIVIGVDEAMLLEAASKRQLYPEALRHIVDMNHSSRLVFVLPSFLSAYQIATAVNGQVAVQGASRKARIIPLPTLSLTAQELEQAIEAYLSSTVPEAMQPILARTMELQRLSSVRRHAHCHYLRLDCSRASCWQPEDCRSLFSPQERADLTDVVLCTSGHPRSLASLAEFVCASLMRRAKPGGGSLLTRASMVCVMALSQAFAVT